MVAQQTPESDDAATVLAWAAERFGDRIALVSSLGPQTLVAIDMLSKMERMLPIILIDTGLLFAETYALRDRLIERYHVTIRTVSPDLDLAAQAKEHGDRLWGRDPDLCCHLRKVVPLKKALFGLDAWISGLRRDQSSARSGVRTVEWDERHGLVKVNPLAHWSQSQTLTYLRENDVPYNPLLDQGWPSLGCQPCTKRPADPLDERAGRWTDSKKTECGLHFSTSADGRLQPEERPQ